MKKILSGSAVVILIVIMALAASYTSESQLQDREDAMLLVYHDMRDTYDMILLQCESNEAFAKLPAEIYGTYARAIEFMHNGKPSEAIRAMEEGYMVCERTRGYLLEKAHFEKNVNKSEIVDMLNINDKLADEFIRRIRDIDNVMASK